jgi:exopolyphosphatase / guanosine-5'-triphosphate,3'-diphosphate pyrophosphatase
MNTYAAVDIGTNSTRLVVRRDGEDLERELVITRLGKGVDATGRLDPDAITRTVATLEDYRRRMDHHGVVAVRAAATSAARDAANRDDFFDAAEAALGVRPELLSGHEEGRLSFAGATRGLAAVEGPFLVVDIGGGSTEFIAGTTEPEGAISIDVGAVRLTERFLHHDPPRPEELSNAVGIVIDHLEDVAREVPLAATARTVVGVAGTITTVAAVELGLREYRPGVLHGFRLTRQAAEDVFRTLATEALADRLHNPGLPRERADVIVGGCCVLVAIFRGFDLGELVVSESDILDGLVASIIPP